MLDGAAIDIATIAVLVLVSVLPILAHDAGRTKRTEIGQRAASRKRPISGCSYQEGQGLTLVRIRRTTTNEGSAIRHVPCVS